MRRIAIAACAALALAGCAKKSSSTTIAPAPAAQPSPIGSWAGSFQGDRGDSWPLTGYLERNASSPDPTAVTGKISSPGDVTQRLFNGAASGFNVAGQSFVVAISATLVDEPDADRDRFGYLYAGTFTSESNGVGAVLFRVIPFD